MIHIDKDSTIYIGFTALDGEENLYPRVKIHDISDSLSATIDLSHVSDGKYRGTWAPNTVGYYGVNCIIYTDAGHSTESSKYGRDGATYKVDEVETKVGNIEADTNELQTDWVNGGRLDLILDELTTQGDTNEGKIDTVDTVVDNILVDTNELQTDWKDTGRLDTILDAVAIEANIETHVTNSLDSYDPPTRTEATTDKTAIIAEIDDNETKINAIASTVNANFNNMATLQTTLIAEIDGVAAEVWDEDLDSHTVEDSAGKDLNYLHAWWDVGGALKVAQDGILEYVEDIEADTDELQADWVNAGRLDNILDALAIEANVETHVTNSLNSYDPPTRTELTTDKNSIIAEVNANETKIDIIQGNVTSVFADTNELQIDWTDGGRLDLLLDAVKAKTDIVEATSVVADAVWDEIEADHTVAGSFAEVMTFLKDIEGGRWIRDGTQMKFYKDDNVTLVATFNLKDAAGSAAGETDDAYERERV